MATQFNIGSRYECIDCPFLNDATLNGIIEITDIVGEGNYSKIYYKVIEGMECDSKSKWFEPHTIFANHLKETSKEERNNTMFTTNTIIRPLTSADSEYSVCGYSVLRKAKVIDVYARKENGNNIKIEILEHVNPAQIGKKYSVDDRYFEAVEQDWIWVDAYKGTDANMRCRGKQYRMNIEDTYGDKVVLGSKGYHVCTDLKHCFKTYDYNFSNRFFKVKALVNAKEYQYRNPNNTTLVAKAIKFVEEITDAPVTIAAKRATTR